MPPDPTLVRLAATYGRQTNALRARIEGVAQRMWSATGSYRDADARRFVQTFGPVLEAGQRTMAALTDAYLARFERIARDVHATPAGVPPQLVSEEALRGVTVEEAYRRPYITVWTALAQDEALDTAVELGRQRLVDLTGTDLQLAKTHTARHVLAENDAVVGYRRVLNGAHSCGLCIVASTQRYRRGDLQPIHPGCDCGIAPIFGDTDPGQIVDPGRLAGVHERLQERFGVSDAGARAPIDYREVLVVHEHGELGPVLGVRGQDFTGPTEI